jgi:ribonuclease J
MQLTIHRGSREIGGTCIELRSGNSKILIDFGLPIVDQNRAPFDFRKIADQSEKNLQKSGLLPPISGLYRDQRSEISAILLSHPHQDHYGLLSYVNPQIPIYLSKGCKKLIEVSQFFGQTNCKLENVHAVDAWKQFEIADFKITPYLVDHSGFDAFAFLIECEGIKIFYSGDFRGHGRKAVLYDNFLKNPPKAIDYLILEGSMIGRDTDQYKTETDLEKSLEELFSDDIFYFLACSSQNIDRLVSVYKACVSTDRIFVIDPYTAFILHSLKEISANIPQYDWRNMRIFFAPNSYTRKMADNKGLYRFKSGKISVSEIIQFRKRLIVKDNYLARNAFMKIKELQGAKLIYSMWEGYLPDVQPFWDQFGIPILKVHCSGHAYVEDLKRFVKAVKPKHIIPNHTFYPQLYKELFKTSKIIELDDRQAINI